MICPYNFKTVEQMNQNIYEYEDGMTKIHQHKMIEKREFAECSKLDCGAWDPDRCRCGYKGSVDGAI